MIRNIPEAAGRWSDANSAKHDKIARGEARRSIEVNVHGSDDVHVHVHVKVHDHVNVYDHVKVHDHVNVYDQKLRTPTTWSHAPFWDDGQT